MIPTLNVGLGVQSTATFQSRNRETYDSNSIDDTEVWWNWLCFNLVIEKLMIPTGNLSKSVVTCRCRFNLVIEKLMIPTAEIKNRNNRVYPTFQSRNRETYDSNFCHGYRYAFGICTFQSRNRETYDSNFQDIETGWNIGNINVSIS